MPNVLLEIIAENPPTALIGGGIVLLILFSGLGLASYRFRGPFTGVVVV